jgi:hypothetical protein
MKEYDEVFICDLPLYCMSALPIKKKLHQANKHKLGSTVLNISRTGCQKSRYESSFTAKSVKLTKSKINGSLTEHRGDGQFIPLLLLYQ